MITDESYTGILPDFFLGASAASGCRGDGSGV